jgi:hypothetical protein
LLRGKTDGTDKTWKKKKDDDYHEEKDEEEEDAPLPSHNNTVSDMAQEMMRYQTGMHNRTKTNISRGSHGVNNLLDGADLLFKVEEKKGHKVSREVEAKQEEEHLAQEDEEERDEEMGAAQSSRGKFIGVRRSSKKSNDSRSGRTYQLKRWYVDLIKPKVRFSNTA